MGNPRQKLNKPNIKAGIPDIDKIKAQYEAGVSIRQLSLMWNIAYATLYRALKVEQENKQNG